MYKTTLIGLGNMGLPMAQKLINAGYPLTVYNRSADKADKLKGDFKTASSLKEACAGQEIIITMLSEDEVLYQICNGEKGLLNNMEAGAIHISMSTISPDTSRDLFIKHQNKKQHYLSSPVFGGPGAVADAKLFICVSGEEAIKEKVKPILELLSQSVHDFGTDAGAANVVKLAGNFMIMASMETMAEAYALAEKQGLNREQVADFFGETVFNAPVYKKYGSIIANKQYRPITFNTSLGFKDARLASEMASDSQVPAPLLNLVYNRLLSALAQDKHESNWVEGIAGGVSKDAGL